MATAVLSSQGRITIPKPVRDRMNLKPGDRIEVIVQADGTALLIPRRYRLADLKHILPPPKRALTVEEMNEAIAAAIVEKHQRSRS